MDESAEKLGNWIWASFLPVTINIPEIDKCFLTPTIYNSRLVFNEIDDTSFPIVCNFTVLLSFSHLHFIAPDFLFDTFSQFIVCSISLSVRNIKIGMRKATRRSQNNKIHCGIQYGTPNHPLSKKWYKIVKTFIHLFTIYPIVHWSAKWKCQTQLGER